jgi:hypothetical protein
MEKSFRKVSLRWLQGDFYLLWSLLGLVFQEEKYFNSIKIL